MPRFTRWLAVLAVAATGLIAGPAAAKTIPSGAPGPQDLTTIVPVMWQGQLWMGRMSPVLHQGPAPNYWLATPQTVYTDSSGALHLVATHIAGNWYSAGVNSVKSDYGYGDYRFVIDSHLGDFDPNAVVGMFTYDKTAANGHNEIDVELSRWGVPDPTAANAQFVIQPWRIGNHIRRFPAPTDRPLTFEYNWQPNKVVFRVYDGTSANSPVIKRWVAHSAPVPSSNTKMHLNMWFFRGRPPYDNSSQEVVFQSFTYTPAS